MENIDKDIERVKEIINNNYLEDLSYLREENDYKIFNQAIENVLSEFQALREFSAEEVINTAELQVELKTYKKIAEKLASKLNEAYFEQNDFGLFFEKEILKGIEADYRYVGDVIIEWARKEVESNGKE